MSCKNFILGHFEILSQEKLKEFIVKREDGYKQTEGSEEHSNQNSNRLAFSAMSFLRTGHWTAFPKSIALLRETGGPLQTLPRVAFFISNTF